MPQTFLEIIKLTLPGLVVAIATAFIAVRLSLRQFRREQLWTRRYEAYTRLLEILDTNKRYAAVNEEYYLEMHPSENLSAKLDVLRKRWERQRPDYARLVLLGSVQLPRAARDALQQYEERRKLASKMGDPLEAIDMDYDATVECMEKIGEIARKDLGVS